MNTKANLYLKYLCSGVKRHSYFQCNSDKEGTDKEGTDKEGTEPESP